MAAVESVEHLKPSIFESTATNEPLSTYLGLSFAVFLGLLPRASLTSLSTLQARNRALSLKLFQAEEQLRFMRSRRTEDSKANARVVEIFASHRNGWQQEEKRLIQQIEASAEEIERLKSRISDLERSEADLRSRAEELQREVSERDEMIGFMSRRFGGGEEEEEFEKEVEIQSDYGGSDLLRIGKVRFKQGLDAVPEVCPTERNGGDSNELADLYRHFNGYARDFASPLAYKAWMERPITGQDLPYESPESMYHVKHYVSRRESPWKVDGESTGVSLKLKLLEQELLNLEKVWKGELSRVPSLMRKQAKRYQALAGKIDDLCKRMQASDPCDPTLSSEFRTQRQTEFLLETFRLQQRATETGQKLASIQAEVMKSQLNSNELGGRESHATTRKSLDSIRNNFKEIQRNLEIWLARIMGDVEGILARDGASRVRDYYISGYPPHM
ncbi:hypothetical protein QJS04_geneDACA008929 [Acorus gramineus]|uniref:Uncharacterized protein n=1 Tax=Acorus gramineus TaxID=55184 RepID=A0AAV9ADT5_ACOGR|nr:hypothetical protein QJS04_geneDACA008929 [Acorus gramineus]